MQFTYLKCTFSSAKIWWSWMAKQKPPMYMPRKQPQQTQLMLKTAEQTICAWGRRKDHIRKGSGAEP